MATTDTTKLPVAADAASTPQPVAQPEDGRALAPWPLIDRYPTVIGKGLTLGYLSNTLRLSTTGFRQQYVDLLEEMIEKDPHAYAVLSKRILGVAGGRLEVTAADAESGSNDEKLALEAAKAVSDQLHAIPDLQQHLSALQWAVFYGLVGCENHWVRNGSGWAIERLSLVHSRRLSYPKPGSWDLHLWDQGQVLSPWVSAVTNRMFGLRIADYPGKFIIHAPQIRGSYPTREGLGRQIAYWMALKLVGSRGAPNYLERFARPWPEATYTTGDGPDSKPRPATDEDIAKAQAAMQALGTGTLSSYVHPDTIKFDLRTPETGNVGKLTFSEWINLCNDEISKAVLGGTLSTSVGSTGGNRALGDTQKKSETQLLGSDASALGGTVKRDLVVWWLRLNMPKLPPRLYPNVKIHVEEEQDPNKVIERAARAAAAGMPVDADEIAKHAGIPLVKPGDTKARRMFPIMAVKGPAEFDRDLAQRAEEIADEFAPEEAESTTSSNAASAPTDLTKTNAAATDGEPLDQAAEE